MSNSRVDEFFNSFSKEGVKNTAYKSISNGIDSSIFNVLVMNENKMREIYNCVDWNSVIVTNKMNPIFKSSIVYLKLMTAIVDHSDVINIEKILNAYLNREISDEQANNFLMDLLIALGASKLFYQNSMVYINSIIR